MNDTAGNDTAGNYLAGQITARSDLTALPDRVRLELHFEAAAMAREVAALAGPDWTRHFVPANFRGDWSVIPLRAPRGAVHPILRITSHPGCDEWDDTEFLTQCPAIAAALARFHCDIGAARLMRLSAGSSILEHSDADLCAAFGTTRLHIPIQTNPDVDFRLAGRRVDMAEGECWYLQLSEPHSVVNGGATDRVHLVIDAVVNDWLAEQLAAPVWAAGATSAMDNVPLRHE